MINPDVESVGFRLVFQTYIKLNDRFCQVERPLIRLLLLAKHAIGPSYDLSVEYALTICLMLDKRQDILQDLVEMSENLSQFAENSKNVNFLRSAKRTFQDALTKMRTEAVVVEELN